MQALAAVSPSSRPGGGSFRRTGVEQPLCQLVEISSMGVPVVGNCAARCLFGRRDRGLTFFPEVPEGAVAGLSNAWAAVTLDGVRSTAAPGGATGPAFTAALHLTEVDGAGADDVALGLVLPIWTLLGMLDRAIELTIAHIALRAQFGQPLSAFQGVQFQLTDAEVERAGVDILATHALWSLDTDDALALRLAAIEAAEVVFRVCHQLHGAVGFCDETTLSWLSRHSQPLRRLPFGVSATRAQLTRRIGRRGLTGLFS